MDIDILGPSQIVVPHNSVYSQFLLKFRNLHITAHYYYSPGTVLYFFEKLILFLCWSCATNRIAHS